uniref:Uncharacterized protein n=1 Tax=Cacopsylla melanoneura TaxID=428564 RepID=A0A8D9EKC1_9HEMI
MGFSLKTKYYIIVFVFFFLKNTLIDSCILLLFFVIVLSLTIIKTEVTIRTTFFCHKFHHLFLRIIINYLIFHFILDEKFPLCFDQFIKLWQVFTQDTLLFMNNAQETYLFGYTGSVIFYITISVPVVTLFCV